MLTFIIIVAIAAVVVGIVYLWRTKGPAIATGAATALGAALWAAWGTVWDALMAFAALFGA